MKAVFLFVLVAASLVLAQNDLKSFKAAEIVASNANSDVASEALEAGGLGGVRSADNAADKEKERKINKKVQAALGPAYIAINQALGPRTQAYVNNWFQALGYGPLIGFFRNLFASAGRLQYISFVRQFAALYGGASGYQLALFIRAFGSPADFAQAIAPYYKEIGASLLVLLQQMTISSGGRASNVPAQIAFAVHDGSGEEVGIDTTVDLIAAVNNKPRALGALVGLVARGLNLSKFVELIEANYPAFVPVVEAAFEKGVVDVFDFSELTTFTPAKAAAIIIAAIKDADYF